MSRTKAILLVWIVGMFILSLPSRLDKVPPPPFQEGKSSGWKNINNEFGKKDQVGQVEAAILSAGIYSTTFKIIKSGVRALDSFLDNSPAEPNFNPYRPDLVERMIGIDPYMKEHYESGFVLRFRNTQQLYLFAELNKDEIEYRKRLENAPILGSLVGQTIVDLLPLALFRALWSVFRRPLKDSKSAGDKAIADNADSSDEFVKSQQLRFKLKRKTVIAVAGAIALWCIAFPAIDFDRYSKSDFILATTNDISYGKTFVAILGIAIAAGLLMCLFPENPSDAISKKRKWIIGVAGVIALFFVAFPPVRYWDSSDGIFIMSITKEIEYGKLSFVLIGIVGAASLLLYLLPDSE